jgi:hypothetical protein
MLRWIACLLVAGLAACSGGKPRDEKPLDAGAAEVMKGVTEQVGNGAQQADEALRDAGQSMRKAGQEAAQKTGEWVDDAEDADDGTADVASDAPDEPLDER